MFSPGALSASVALLSFCVLLVHDNVMLYKEEISHFYDQVIKEKTGGNYNGSVVRAITVDI